MPAGRLSTAQRSADLQRLGSQQFDVLVIGGGVTGAGAALDASCRGLSVALVEARDLAAGTSSRSGKTLHGGLRYLARGDLGLVREALRERNLMVERLCPHLARPEPFLYPLSRRLWDRAHVGAGVLLYDLLGGARHGIPHHRHLSRAGALREVPALDPERVVGAISYQDVRIDDARHTVTLARTAARHGAAIVVRAPVTALLRSGQRITGARVRDLEGGGELEVRAHAVINATGVWAEQVQRLAGPPAIELRPSKGVHIVVPRERLAARSGLIFATADNDNVLVSRRWWDYWIIGTTDTAWSGDPDDPLASADDVAHILGELNRWLRRPLASSDVCGAYAGLRPLISTPASSTSALSREHAVAESAPGLLTIVGGKYTTYRTMARDVVDAARPRLPGTVPDSSTESVPLLGAEGIVAIRRGRRALSAESGLDVAWIEHLLDRYGTLAEEVLALVGDRPELGRPLEGAPGYLAAELVYGVTHEGALSLADLLERRTRTSIERADGGRAAAGPAAALAAGELGWDDARREAEVEEFLARARAERRARGALEQ